MLGPPDVGSGVNLEPPVQTPIDTPNYAPVIAPAPNLIGVTCVLAIFSLFMVVKAGDGVAGLGLTLAGTVAAPPKGRGGDRCRTPLVGRREGTVAAMGADTSSRQGGGAQQGRSKNATEKIHTQHKKKHLRHPPPVAGTQRPPGCQARTGLAYLSAGELEPPPHPPGGSKPTDFFSGHTPGHLARGQRPPPQAGHCGGAAA